MTITIIIILSRFVSWSKGDYNKLFHENAVTDDADLKTQNHTANETSLDSCVFDPHGCEIVKVNFEVTSSDAAVDDYDRDFVHVAFEIVASQLAVYKDDNDNQYLNDMETTLTMTSRGAKILQDVEIGEWCYDYEFWNKSNNNKYNHNDSNKNSNLRRTRSHHNDPGIPLVFHSAVPRSITVGIYLAPLDQRDAEADGHAACAVLAVLIAKEILDLNNNNNNNNTSSILSHVSQKLPELVKKGSQKWRDLFNDGSGDINVDIDNNDDRNDRQTTTTTATNLRKLFPDMCLDIDTAVHALSTFDQYDEASFHKDDDDSHTDKNNWKKSMHIRLSHEDSHIGFIRDTQNSKCALSALFEGTMTLHAILDCVKTDFEKLHQDHGTINSPVLVYIVSWAGHHCVMCVSDEGITLVDTLGERLQESLHASYMLHFKADGVPVSLMTDDDDQNHDALQNENKNYNDTAERNDFSFEMFNAYEAFYHYMYHYMMQDKRQALQNRINNTSGHDKVLEEEENLGWQESAFQDMQIELQRIMLTRD